MGTLVLKECPRWLNLANLFDREMDDVLDTPNVPEGILSSALALMRQHCEAKKNVCTSLHPPHLPHQGESNGATFCSLIFSCSAGLVRADCCLHFEEEEEGGLTSSLTCGDTAETSPFRAPHGPVSQPPLTTSARNDSPLRCIGWQKFISCCERNLGSSCCARTCCLRRKGLFFHPHLEHLLLSAWPL